MIDLRRLRDDPSAFRASLGRKRYSGESLDRVLALDAELRQLKTTVEEQRAVRNTASREVPRAQGEEKERLLTEMKAVAPAVVTMGAYSFLTFPPRP